VTLPSGKKLMMFGAQIEDAKAEDGKPADSTKPY
jgi:hypothetical protein